VGVKEEMEFLTPRKVFCVGGTKNKAWLSIKKKLKKRKKLVTL